MTDIPDAMETRDQMVAQEAQDHREMREEPDTMDLKDNQERTWDEAGEEIFEEIGDTLETLAPQDVMPCLNLPLFDTCPPPKDPLATGDTTDTQVQMDVLAMLVALEGWEHLADTDQLVTGATQESQDSAEGKESQDMVEEQLERPELAAHRDTLEDKELRESLEYRVVQELAGLQEIHSTT